MTWELKHNDEIIGSWTDDFIDKVAEKIKTEKIDNNLLDILSEFLPSPLSEAHVLQAIAFDSQ